MKIKIYSKPNTSTKDVTLPDTVVSATNQKVISEYINFVRAASRTAIANAKDRAQVSGGGKKPWRQKGTGNARHGSSRSPLWVGGGVTFGPDSARNFWLNYPKKFRQYARYAILNVFANSKKLIVVESLTNSISKTKQAEELLQSYGLEGKLSVILSEEEYANSLAFRNLAYVTLMTKSLQDIVTIASSDYLIFSEEGFDEYFNNKKVENEAVN